MAINGGKPNNFAEHSEKAFKTVFDVFLAKTSSNNKKVWTIFRKQRFFNNSTPPNGGMNGGEIVTMRKYLE